MIRLIRLIAYTYLIYHVYLETGINTAICLSLIAITVEIQTISITRLWDAFKLWRGK